MASEVLLITLLVRNLGRGEKVLQVWSEPEFPGGSVSLNSHLVWMEGRCGGSEGVGLLLPVYPQ